MQHTNLGVSAELTKAKEMWDEAGEEGITLAYFIAAAKSFMSFLSWGVGSVTFENW